MLPDSVLDLPDLLPLLVILVTGLGLAAGGVGDCGDLVLLLQLLGYSSQLAQRPADQHNVLTTLGQLFTNAFSCNEFLQFYSFTKF